MKDDAFLVLLIYVDDLVLTGSHPHHCQSFKEYLHKCFKLKDLGPLQYFLGIDIACSGVIYVSVEVYYRYII